METGGDYSHDECCVMYQLVKSLCCITETDMTFYVNYTSIIKKSK